MKLIYTQGLPASGKTTWAKAYQRSSLAEIFLVSKDDLRFMLYQNKAFTSFKEDLVNEIEEKIIISVLSKGKDVIVHDTNFNPKRLKTLENIGLEVGAEVEKKSFLHVPLEVCIERDKKRSLRVGEVVIRSMYEKYIYLFKNEN